MTIRAARRCAVWLAAVSLALSAAAAPGPSPAHAGASAPTYGSSLGVTLASPGNARYVPQLGMGWARLVLSWNDSEPAPGQFDWAGADTVVAQAGPYARLILQVAYTPAWARPDPADPLMTPPRDPQDLARFLQAAATRYRGRVAAYELWNEPNLGMYWGNRKPDAAGYVALLRAVRPALRTADPAALLVAAGPQAVGDRDDAEAIGQERYLRDMYRAGLAGLADVIALHIYGYTTPPEAAHAHAAGFYFREAEVLHGVMEAMGDGARPVWITEMGWLAEAPCAIPGGHSWQQVPATEQADYTVRAIQYARQHWPWAGVLVVFNLDYSMMPWPGPCDDVRWRSLLDADGTPRPIFDALHRLASAPLAGPPPGDAGDPWYFAATGYTLATPFRAYWTAHGGLAALGYPLTAAGEEGDFLVQYTERARLEWHPENAGTPYEVLLARLGAWLRPEQAGPGADSRLPGGADPAALAAHGWPPEPASETFAATGYLVAGPFLRAWRGGGGLAQFGYPLTPARLEQDERGAPAVVQWFERARFEWRPENAGTPYEVLQGRLGAELLRLWGW
jgi:hypothetical protein